jgi:hypothetical protein
MTRLANVAGTCGIAPHAERLVLAEQVTITLADLAAAVGMGSSSPTPEGPDHGSDLWWSSPDPLHAIYGRPARSRPITAVELRF